jgi:hypothetical protein
VLRVLRRHLTYANVMATIAVFIALGSGAYAAATITGRDVKDGSLTGRDIKRNSLTGKQIVESKLGTVRRARNAARLGGRRPSRYLVRCPGGTIPLASTCIETRPRPVATYSSAAAECDRVDRPATLGRRLPNHGELMAALSYDPITLAPGGELTSNVYPPSSPGGPLDVMTIVTATGGVAIVPNSVAGGLRQFRCAVNPIN